MANSAPCHGTLRLSTDQGIGTGPGTGKKEFTSCPDTKRQVAIKLKKFYREMEEKDAKDDHKINAEKYM